MKDILSSTISFCPCSPLDVFLLVCNYNLCVIAKNLIGSQFPRVRLNGQSYTGLLQGTYQLALIEQVETRIIGMVIRQPQP